MIITILARIGLISCLLLFHGCSSIGYLTHTAGGHLELMSKRQPITSVLERKDINSSTRQALTDVQRIRKYATSELNLPDNNSYNHYVELDRDYVTWVVFAAPELSLQATTWCFWIVGCVPYRGYFDHEKAVEFAEQMHAMNLEVHIAPVAAYSTLGWFSDPVLSSMLSRGKVATADTIFHELAHQQLYFKDDTEFNEAFATAVARAGVRDWLNSLGEQKLLMRYEDNIVKKNQLYQKIQKLRQQLDSIYQSSNSDAAKRKQKELAFEEYRIATNAMISGWKHEEQYRTWALQDINNAKLNAMSTYQELTTEFLSLLSACNNEYTRFYHVVASTKELNEQERRNYLKRFMCKQIDGVRDVQ